MTASAPYKKDLHISWEDIFRDTEDMSHRVAKKGTWKGIVAITRGGLIPAAIVSRVLDIKLIETLCISSYDHKDQGNLTVIKKPDLGDGSGWIIVDDLVDTGKTFIETRKLFPKAHYACVYAKPNGVPTADTFVKEVSQETWIHFPWEVVGN